MSTRYYPLIDGTLEGQLQDVLVIVALPPNGRVDGWTGIRHPGHSCGGSVGSEDEHVESLGCDVAVRDCLDWITGTGCVSRDHDERCLPELCLEGHMNGSHGATATRHSSLPGLEAGNC